MYCECEWSYNSNIHYIHVKFFTLTSKRTEHNSCIIMLLYINLLDSWFILFYW